VTTDKGFHCRICGNYHAGLPMDFGANAPATYDSIPQSERETRCERIAKLPDPFGHKWMLGSHIEDVTPEETPRRFNTLLEG